MRQVSASAASLSSLQAASSVVVAYLASIRRGAPPWWHSSRSTRSCSRSAVEWSYAGVNPAVAESVGKAGLGMLVLAPVTQEAVDSTWVSSSLADGVWPPVSVPLSSHATDTEVAAAV